MEIIESNSTHEIKYDKTSNIVNFKLTNQELDLDTFRSIWDHTIEVVRKNKSCKVLFDSRDTTFPNIENLLYLTEGLVQIMCNEIKSKILYFAYILNDSCYKSINPNTKFHQEFNQFKEIEYDFFKDSLDATTWLLNLNYGSNKKFSNAFLDIFKITKKTTSELQAKKLEEILKIDTTDPLYQLYKSIISDDNKYQNNR
jgi:hypothetical protein